MNLLMLLAGAAVFAGLAGLGATWPHCVVCADPLWPRRWWGGVCPACWVTWVAAVQGRYQEHWQAAYGRLWRAGYWGPYLRRRLAGALEEERRRHVA